MKKILDPKAVTFGVWGLKLVWAQKMYQTLKVVFTSFLLVCFLSPNKSTCQTRKNAFCFTSKNLFHS